MRKVLGVLACALLLSALTAAPVTAGDEDVIRTGACSGRSDWKLKLSPDNGRLEVEYEVDQNVNGQTWRVRMFHNGERFFAGTRTTQAPSGSFSVRRVVDDVSGTDIVRARARNPKTEELCTGRAVF